MSTKKPFQQKRLLENSFLKINYFRIKSKTVIKNKVVIIIPAINPDNDEATDFPILHLNFRRS